MSPRDDQEQIWRHSTEGDLDPDLTEEAGESPSDWLPPARRSLLPAILGVVALLLLIAFLAPLFL